MLPIRRSVALGKTKIDDVDIVLGGVIASYKEVIWLDVSMDNALLMHYFNSLNLFKISQYEI